MPTRNPSGAVTSWTVRITCPFQIGCQSASQRMRPGMAKPMPMKIGVTQRTRSQPGPGPAVDAGRAAGGAAWCVVGVCDVGHDACRQILHEVVELLRRRAVRRRCRRHRVRVAGLDVGVRLHDRLADEVASSCRGAPSAASSFSLSRSGPTLPFAPAGLKRVAAAAAALLEDGEPGAAPAAWPPPLSHVSNVVAPRGSRRGCASRRGRGRRARCR